MAESKNSSSLSKHGFDSANATAETDNNKSRKSKFELADVEQHITSLSETENSYTYDGRDITIPSGISPPLRHWKQVNNKLPARETVKNKIDVAYDEKVEDMGYEHFSNWEKTSHEEMEEILREKVDEEFSWRREEWDEGQIPTQKYFREENELPNPRHVLRTLSDLESWKEIPEFLKENEEPPKEKVDVDVSSFLQ